MLDKLNTFVREKQLIESDSNILVAVSGGVDSMVLASVLLRAGHAIAIAHCNYQLRGKESDRDEELVRNWALERNIPFHSIRIDTKRLVKESARSTQMIAREERYRFFEELMEQYGYAVTALAHHQDDRIESLLMNVLRGTGIRGFVGMPVKRDRYIRPLLFATKKDIRKYAEKNEVLFREDVSNQQVGYKRNWVRLRLLPMLRQADANIDKRLVQFTGAAEKELPNYYKWIEEDSDKLMMGNNQQISISRLKEHRFPFTILKEFLKPKGFSSDQVFQILDMLNSTSGVEVSTKNARVIKDRDQLIIGESQVIGHKPELIYIELPRAEVTSLQTASNEVLLDAEKVKKEKLHLRHWKKGDRFKPLGMSGWKKLSDFFIDSKMSVFEKEQVWLLTFNEKIVWVVGKRLDDRFKVTPKTKKVLKVQTTPNQ